MGNTSDSEQVVQMSQEQKRAFLALGLPSPSASPLCNTTTQRPDCIQQPTYNSQSKIIELIKLISTFETILRGPDGSRDTDV